MDLKQLFTFLFCTKDFILSERFKGTLFLSESVKGILYPHQEVHDIKKENIGLIEVIGITVPGRLMGELKLLVESLMNPYSLEEINKNLESRKHTDWASSILDKYPDLQKGLVEEIFRQEVGLVFTNILEYAGVFQDQPGRQALIRFIDRITAV